MKRTTKLLTRCALAALVIAGVAVASDAGGPAPAFTLTALAGGQSSLDQYKGQVVMLNFWATWCGPCRMEIPEFEQLQKTYAGRLQVIGISVDEVPAAEVAKTATKLGINYPVAMETPAMERGFGAMPDIPVTFVIDPNGQIVQKHYGANTYATFESEVRVLLNLPVQEKVVRIDQMSPYGKVGTIDIPGIADDMKSLTPAQRQKALAKLNDSQCDCGCDLSLASCRVQDPSCGYSLPESKQAIAAIKAGK